jgi:hypothetical protein
MMHIETKMMKNIPDQSAAFPSLRLVVTEEHMVKAVFHKDMLTEGTQYFAKHIHAET